MLVVRVVSFGALGFGLWGDVQCSSVQFSAAGYKSDDQV